jgi:DNA-binding response OmpR family regulator
MSTSSSATCAPGLATGRINLRDANILVLERSKTSLTILVQVLAGFDARNTAKCLSLAEARSVIESRHIDLVILDPTIENDGGYEFVSWLRRRASENRYTPVILVTGHSQESSVKRGLDSGASYFVVKPITPGVLLDRILWIARENRPFIESPDYVGPDRRFKASGPPPGMKGRRAEDTAVIDAAESWSVAS